MTNPVIWESCRRIEANQIWEESVTRRRRSKSFRAASVATLNASSAVKRGSAKPSGGQPGRQQCRPFDFAVERRYRPVFEEQLWVLMVSFQNFQIRLSWELMDQPWN